MGPGKKAKNTFRRHSSILKNLSMSNKETLDTGFTEIKRLTDESCLELCFKEIKCSGLFQ